MIEPTRGRAEAARKHLNVMRSRVAVDLAEAIMYVNLSFTYGLEVSEISDESGMPVELVRRILLGRL